MLSTSLRLRSLTSAHLPFAESLRALAGWNQTLADWQRFLALEPDGCFLAEWEGVSAGTATTIVYGADLAWIGMVLVHPNYRCRGIGRALIEHCIEHLRARGVRCIKLDATADGKRVYSSVGFKEESTLTRWARAAAASPVVAPNSRVRPLLSGDVLEALDTTAFGITRSRLLHALARESRSAFVLQDDPSHIVGYGFLRVGACAHYLGPVVALSSEGGVQLAEMLVHTCTDEKTLWDIPDQNVAALTWARQHGFSPERRLTRMYLGENRVPGDPQKQFAIAGPELG